MPAFIGNYGAGISVITTGQQVALWNNELVSDGQASLEVCLAGNDHLPRAYSIELSFTASDGVTPADPGAFSVSIEHADTDIENFFVTSTTVTTGLNGHFVVRIEVTNVMTKFVRLILTSITNAVYVTAKITR
jgi:hypothetical protein